MNEPTPNHDPRTDSLLRYAELPFSVAVPVLGIPCCLRTNSQRVSERFVDSFGDWSRLGALAHANAAPLDIRVVVYASGAGAAGAIPARHISTEDGRLIVHSAGGIAVVDPLRRESIAYVSPDLVAGDSFREEFLEAMTLALVACFDRHPLHASAIAADGRAVLLAGPSGAGKSTLAWLGHTDGLDFLSDDLVWVQLQPALRVWGSAAAARLRRDKPVGNAPDNAEPRRGRTEKETLTPAGEHVCRYSDRPVVCVLSRGDTVALEPVDGSVLRAELTRQIAPGFDRFPARQDAVMRALTAEGGWHLTLTNDARQALPFLHRMLRRLAVTVLLLSCAVTAGAQQLPTPEQAKRLLETRPDLVAMLRREIASSGLTPDQIRARLRAAGYPEDLLDAYVGPRRVGTDSVSAQLPSSEVLDAVAALGIVDVNDTTTAELRQVLRARRAAAMRDTARVRGVDSVTPDSLALLDSAVVADSLESPGRRRPGARTLTAPGRRRAVASDSGFTIFGLSVFDAATTQFDPNLAGPVDASYRLGPGDRIVLIITGDAERSFTLDVTREGFIVVPGVGEIPVANLTLGQLEEQLYPKLGRVYSGLRRGAGATTHFSLNLARLHSNQVFVLGDVDQPGSYRVSSAGTALTALYASGGPTPNGSMRHVEIRRGGRLVDSLDLYDYFLRADGSHDPRLQSGDVVFVPVHGARVRIYGEVIRPATYELRRGETIADLVRSAGGFTENAARRRVQIARILPPGQRDTTDRARVIIDIASNQFATGNGPAYPLEAGDVVRVFAVSDRVSRRISVKGDLWTPGVIGYTPGMRLSDAVRLAGGIKPDAYLGQVLVSRLRAADSARIQLRTAFVDSTGRPTDDIPLRDDDEIRVFSATEFKTVEFVSITGAVRKPGRVAYREGMTMRDLVMLAGGMEARAFLGAAEIARLPSSRDGGHLAITQRVPLDSSYLLVREQNRFAEQPGAARVHQTPDVVLEPFDNVLILAQPDWERPRRVQLTGEVRFPGTYTLTNKQDRLANVLERAGGLTQSGYADGIVFYRRQGRMGRVGVDLTRVLRDAAYRDNLILQDGDSIFLPPYTGIVEVQGAVNAPRGVAYVPGEDLNYYVRAAGGPSHTADADRAYVTQPDGSVESLVVRFLRPDVIPVPRPGSIVVVTERDASDRVDSVARLGLIAQVIGSLVALVAIVKQL